MSVIVQVTEIVFGSLTTVVLVSLSYVWLWDWRERVEDKAAVEKAKVEEADKKALIHFPPDSAIEPYAEYFLDTPCPKCGDITKAATTKEGFITAGVSVGSDGVVRAGMTLGSVAVPPDTGNTAACAVALADGSILVGTGPAHGGKVVRVAGGVATEYADTKESAVHALAVDRAGNVYAATTSARIYKIAQGKAEVYVTIPDVGSVLSLVADRAGILYAGTGDTGSVVRVEPGGKTSVYFRADDPFVISVAIADDGAVYAGTGGGKALLYRITGPGRASVVHDFHGDNVHAIAIAPKGVVYAVANEEATASTTETSESSAHRTTNGRAAPGPAAARGIAYRPISCNRGQYKNLYRCEVKAVHIHVRCETCRLHWLIAPKQKGENHAARTV
jgi:hypothetical protein